MKGTEKMLAQINAEASKKAWAILARAEAQCAEIRQEYEKKARELYTEKIRAGVSSGQERLENMQKKSRAMGRDEVQRERQKLVDESFALAVANLTALPEEDYRALLVKLALRASEELWGEIVLNPRDKAAHGEALLRAVNEKLGAERLSLSDEVHSFKGGLLLRKGSTELDYTLETLAEKLKPGLSERISVILFD